MADSRAYGSRTEKPRSSSGAVRSWWPPGATKPTSSGSKNTGETQQTISSSAAHRTTTAFCIVDSKTIERFLPPMFKPYQADSHEALGVALGLDPKVFAETIAEYNR